MHCRGHDRGNASECGRGFRQLNSAFSTHVYCGQRSLISAELLFYISDNKAHLYFVLCKNK